MIRIARAAVLAGAVLCVAQPTAAAADGAEWWEVINLPDGGATIIVMADAASSKTIAPDVVETRFLSWSTVDDDITRRWVDDWVQFDCARMRERVAHGVVYEGVPPVGRRHANAAWAAVEPGDPDYLFVCKGERAEFERREDFVPPVG